MDFKFILAPRHMHFLDKYLEYAKSLNLKVLLRSDYKKEVDFDVLILNTYGELAFFYELARFCLIGGSFENIGGHSILEPAIFAPVIFYGPHMQNFRETSLKFEEAGASIRLKDFKDLVANLEILALNKDLCLTMGEIAKGLALANSGVTKRILKDLVTKVPELT